MLQHGTSPRNVLAFGALVLQVPLYTQYKKGTIFAGNCISKPPKCHQVMIFFFLYLSNNRTGSLHQTTFQLIKGQAVGKVQNCN